MPSRNRAGVSSPRRDLARELQHRSAGDLELLLARGRGARIRRWRVAEGEATALVLEHGVGDSGAAAGDLVEQSLERGRRFESCDRRGIDGEDDGAPPRAPDAGSDTSAATPTRCVQAASPPPACHRGSRARPGPHHVARLRAAAARAHSGASAGPERTAPCFAAARSVHPHVPGRLPDPDRDRPRGPGPGCLSRPQVSGRSRASRRHRRPSRGRSACRGRSRRPPQRSADRGRRARPARGPVPAGVAPVASSKRPPQHGSSARRQRPSRARPARAREGGRPARASLRCSRTRRGRRGRTRRRG